MRSENMAKITLNAFSKNLKLFIGNCGCRKRWW